MTRKNKPLFFHMSKSARRHFKHIYYLRFELITLLVVIALVIVNYYLYETKRINAAGIDDVTVSLCTDTGCATPDEGVGAAAVMRVVFTFTTLGNGDDIFFDIGEDTGGDEWGLNGVTTGDIACSDNGAGETYTINSVAAATANDPLHVEITSTTVGAGATQVTCLLGDGSPDLQNPGVAGNYSVGVTTTNDAGAGIAYVGNANDITVTLDTIPNLSMSIDNADGTFCTTTAGVTSCNLGVALTTQVNAGNYDVNVGTNAASGASMFLAEDGNLRNGADDVDDITEDTGTVAAGSEEYGIAVAADAGTWAEQGNFTDDDTPISAGPVLVAQSSGLTDIAGDDVTITHRAAISSATLPRTYSHVVTWTATANF